MTARLRPILLTTVAVVGTATGLIVVLPDLSFAYRGEQAHVAIETAGTLVALLAAFILFGRVRRGPTRGEVLLFTGLLLLFIANLARSVSPSFTGENEAVVWVPLTANLIASAVLAAAVFAPEGQMRRRRGEALRVTGGTVVGAGVLMLATGLLAGHLSTGIDPAISPMDAGDPLVVGSPGLLIAQLASMALFAIAAAGFWRRAERNADEFLAWLAIALTLLALARLNYFLFPSIYSNWMFTGDFLRLAAYAVILAGAFRQIAVFQRAAARTAVLEDRSRIARDLHDSLAQDLAFISLQGDRIAADDERAAELAETARMALATSRGAIEHLRRSEDPLGPTLGRVAKALAERHKLRLELDLDESVMTSTEARDDLLRIASEAISNSVRHGEASEIRIGLAAESEEGVRLVVADNGCGFDADSTPAKASGGMGLPGMRERAERLGGRFEVRSRRGEGTSVEVVVP